MKTGLLWYDDDPATTLEEKVCRLAKHFNRKYGYRPDLCLVHRSVFASRKKKFLMVDGVTVQSGHPILAGYFWAGCQDKKTVAV